MDAQNNPRMDTAVQSDGKTAADSANGGITHGLLASLFHRAARFMMRAHHHQGHAEHAQRHVLAILKRSEPMSQRELLEMLNVRSSSLSELLGKLEQRSFIRRERDEEDKRNVIITLTAEGAAASAESAGQQSTDALFAALSEDEREQLAGLLRKVIASLEQYAADQPQRHAHGGEEERLNCHTHGHGGGEEERWRHHAHERGERAFHGWGGRWKGRDDA
jgi:DNA-binding MarR family transcriptional regulator